MFLLKAWPQIDNVKETHFNSPLHQHLKKSTEITHNSLLVKVFFNTTGESIMGK